MNLSNNVQLIGNVGKMPEIKPLNNGGKLARFSLATQENYKNKLGEWVENTTWHNIVAWNQIAERIEKQITKGSKLIIQGKIVNRQYEDKDGNTRYITEIDARNFMRLENKNNIANAFQSTSMDADGYEDLPF